MGAGGGDGAVGGQRVGDGVRQYAALGARWDISRAEKRLRAHGIRPHRTYRERPATGWAALTPTEQHIADLVVQGLSNPDIAAALFLSRNTVHTHVSHILAKTGIRSRAV